MTIETPDEETLAEIMRQIDRGTNLSTVEKDLIDKLRYMHLHKASALIKSEKSRDYKVTLSKED